MVAVFVPVKEQPLSVAESVKFQLPDDKEINEGISLVLFHDPKVSVAPLKVPVNEIFERFETCAVGFAVLAKYEPLTESMEKLIEPFCAAFCCGCSRFSKRFPHPVMAKITAKDKANAVMMRKSDIFLFNIDLTFIFFITTSPKISF